MASDGPLSSAAGVGGGVMRGAAGVGAAGGTRVAAEDDVAVLVFALVLVSLGVFVLVVVDVASLVVLALVLVSLGAFVVLDDVDVVSPGGGSVDVEVSGVG